MNNERNRPEEFVATGTGAARAPETRGMGMQSREQQAIGEERHAALFQENEASDMRRRWDTIQTGFVDDPRSAVKQADELVDTAIRRLSDMFTNERKNLEGHWDRGDDVSTEDLRVALQRYRSFFGRLLSL